MSTYEDLPGDAELLAAFPEAAGLLAGEESVALEAIMSVFQQETAESLQMKFDNVRALIGIFGEQFGSRTPTDGHWQSVHKFKRTDGELRLWVLSDSSDLMLRVVSNEEVRDGGVPTIHYREFAVHSTEALFGRRSASATRPEGAVSWQAADLGTCSLMECSREKLRFTRGTHSGPPVMIGPESSETGAERMHTEIEIRDGLQDVENLLGMFVSGSCYEPGLIGIYR